MRVLFLQRQPCMRALKYAVGLRSALPGIHLSFAYQGGTLSDYYGSGDELFDRWMPLGRDPEPSAAIAEAIEHARPDVVHSHNLPDLLTVLALEVAAHRVPIIHDVHDMQALRRTPYRDGFPEPADTAALERAAVEGAAALVTVSDELLDEVTARYRVPTRSLVFANYVLTRDLPESADPPASRPPGPVRMVYQGSLGADGGHYDLRDIFRRLTEAGATLDVHPARPAPAYAALAGPRLTVHAPTDPAALMRVLPRYDVGWAGFNVGLNRAHIDTALPNKLFDYLGAGLPVATLGHRALARFVTAHGVGWVAATPEGVVEALRNGAMDGIGRRVHGVREQVTIEHNIGRLVALYRDVAGVAARPAAAAISGTSPQVA